MGAKNSSTLKTENITEAVTKIITNTVQSASQSANLTQEVIVDCTEIQDIASDKYRTCLTDNRNVSIENRVFICKPILDLALCKVSDINQTGTMIIDLKVASDQTTLNNITSNLTNNLENSIKQETGAPFDSNKSKQEIQNIVKNVTAILSNKTQEIMQEINGLQTVQLKSGGSISGVNQKSAQTYFGDILQRDKQYNDAVSTVVNTVKSEVDQKTAGGDFIKNIVIAVVGILFIIFIFILLLRYLFRKKSENQTIDINVKN